VSYCLETHTNTPSTCQSICQNSNLRNTIGFTCPNRHIFLTEPLHTFSVSLQWAKVCCKTEESFKYLSLPPSFCASSPGFVLLISDISGISYLWPPASSTKCDHIQLGFVKCLALFSGCWVSVKLWNDLWKGLTYLKKTDYNHTHTHAHFYMKLILK